MVEEIVKGDLRVCPRCKGYGYILGQKRYKDTDYESFLPNYKQNKKGLCFLCDGKKEAFFTEDNRVIKFKKDKKGKSILIEFCPYTGDLIGEIDDTEHKELDFQENLSSPNELFFQEGYKFMAYEFVTGEKSPIIDAIFDKFKNADIMFINQDIQSISVDKLVYSIDFALCYDRNFNLINPFYINPVLSECDALYLSVILPPDDQYYISVAGFYLEDDDMVYLAVQSKDGIKDSRILDFTRTFNMYKNNISFKEEDIFNLTNDKDNKELFDKLAVKIMKDIKDLTGVTTIF